MKNIKGKNVFITGASAGLGRAIAVAFAKSGANVGMIARTEDALKDTCREIQAVAQVKVFYAVADTSKVEQLVEATSKLTQELGACDIWVNNAMETVFSRFINITPQEFQRVTDVDYLGFVYGTMEALKMMLPRNQGHIIQVGSALAYRSIPLQSAYCGAKAAIRGFTDSLRCELMHDKENIQLTIVQMPALNTPQFTWARTHIPHQPEPVGTIFQPEVGADAVVHAAKYPRREYWVGGSTVAAIIGNKFFPGWMDRKMAQMSYVQQWIKDSARSLQDGNLFQPADLRAHTTHGQFSHKSKSSSMTWTFMKMLSRLFN